MTTQSQEQRDVNGETKDERNAHLRSIEEYIEANGPQALYKTTLEWFATYSVQSRSFNLKRWLDGRVTRHIKTNEDALRKARQAIASLGHPLNVFISGDALLARKALSDSEYVGCGFIFYPAKTKSGNAVLNCRYEFMPEVDVDGYPVVSRVVPGSPADRADFRPGDTVISIDGRSTRNRSIDSLTGQVDSHVGKTVSVRRSCDKHPLSITQESTPVLVTSARCGVYGDIGYIRLSTFLPQDLPGQTIAAMSELDDCKAIVLDLRGSPGGSATLNLNMLSIFLEQGLMFTVHNDADEPWIMRYSVEKDCLVVVRQDGTPAVLPRSPYQLRHRPLYLLVDGNTRSAPEAFTQALRDHGATAKVIGSRSFGKGVVQGAIELFKYALIEVLYGRWVSPNGTWIGDAGVSAPGGIVPDVEIKSTPGVLFGEPGDRVLATAIELASDEIAARLVDSE